MKRFIVTLVGLAALALTGCTVESGPVSDTYLSCVDDFDCGSDQCLQINLGGSRVANHCSHTCSSDADCESFNGIASACYELFGDPGRNLTCFERCNIDADCTNLDFCCTTATMGGVPTDAICVPCG